MLFLVTRIQTGTENIVNSFKRDIEFFTVNL